MPKLLLVLMFPLFSYCQKDSSASHTMLGQIDLKIGTIIKKEYKDIYKWGAKKLFISGNGNIEIKMLTITDAASGIRAKGLLVSTFYPSTTYSAYIDADEVDGLLKFLEFAIKLNGTSENNEIEYVFHSKDLFFAAYNTKVKNEIVWNYQITVNQYFKGYSTVYLASKDMDEIHSKILEITDQIKY